MTKVLIDSDIILDFLFDRQPFSESSGKILALCDQRAIDGYITPVIFSNVYYLLRKNANHDLVVEKLNSLISILDILIIDEEVIRNALSSGFADLEDAIQNYSAVKSGNIDVILTRNLRDYRKSDLMIKTPDDFLRAFDYSAK